MSRPPNKITAANAGRAFRLRAVRHRPGIAEFGRSAKKRILPMIPRLTLTVVFLGLVVSGCTSVPKRSGLPDVAPVPLVQVAPVYPENLLPLGVSGRVVVGFNVREDGTVVDPYIIQSVHPALDAAAVTAVLQWKFRPGLFAGKPTLVHMKQEFTFAVEDAKK
jgi:TonB family protein